MNTLKVQPSRSGELTQSRWSLRILAGITALSCIVSSASWAAQQEEKLPAAPNIRIHPWSGKFGDIDVSAILKKGDRQDNEIIAITRDTLIDLIKNQVAVGTWGGDNGYTVEWATADNILVINSPEAQREISELLTKVQNKLLIRKTIVVVLHVGEFEVQLGKAKPTSLVKRFAHVKNRTDQLVAILNALKKTRPIVKIRLEPSRETPFGEILSHFQALRANGWEVAVSGIED